MKTSKRACVGVLSLLVLVTGLSMGSAASAQDGPSVDIHEVVGAGRHLAPLPPPVARPVSPHLYATLLGMLIGVTTSAWVGYDMHKHHVRGPWVMITLLIWIVGLPLYLARRRALIEAATKEWEFLSS